LVLGGVTGCDSSTGPHRSPSGSSGDFSLTISQESTAGPQGQLLVEGGLAEVRLTGMDGRTRTERGDPNEPLTFSALHAGSYLLEAATRPCNANCGDLAARIDSCQVRVTLPDTARLHIRYVATRPCSISILG
jgi:hypothetical protein